MNIHLELLGRQTSALQRMRNLAAADPWSKRDYEADLLLLTKDISRVEDRVRFWEETLVRLLPTTPV